MSNPGKKIENDKEIVNLLYIDLLWGKYKPNDFTAEFKNTWVITDYFCGGSRKNGSIGKSHLAVLRNTPGSVFRIIKSKHLHPCS